VLDTLVTIDLHEVPGGTELALTHALLATQAQRDSHEHGWNGTLDRLAETTKENNA
jgi:uncharacterized protein YndB with AHSA1/START domain